jgi:hypothetical protein
MNLASGASGAPVEMRPEFDPHCESFRLAQTEVICAGRSLPAETGESATTTVSPVAI